MNNPIYIHLGKPDADMPIGRSHWWGYPDMPETYEIPFMPNPDAFFVPSADGEEWDMTEEEEPAEIPMTFICQINLSDLPASGHGMPHSGLLLFFGDIDYYRGIGIEPGIGMHISENEAVRVVYVPAEDMDKLVRRYDASIYEEDPPLALRLDEERPTLEEPEHQFFGTSSHLEWEDWPEPCEGWQLLLQMDSMEGDDYSYNFVDWGVLCFLVHPQALKAFDFSDVRAIILST